MAERHAVLKATVVSVASVATGLLVTAGGWYFNINGNRGDQAKPPVQAAAGSDTTAAHTTVATTVAGDGGLAGGSELRHDTPRASPTTSAEPAEGSALGVEDPDGAWAATVPAGWVQSRGERERTTIFTDTSSGATLLVEWTPDPGPDPLASWREQASSFSERHEGYEEIRLDATEFGPYPAAWWEFRHVDDETGRTRHTADLGFVTDTKGYALLFETAPEDWAHLAGTFAAFRDSFVPIP